MDPATAKRKRIDSDGLSVTSLDESSRSVSDVEDQVEKPDKKTSAANVTEKHRKLNEYKKCLRAAGVFVSNYNKYFSDCETESEKIKKIKRNLIDIGHDGSRITLNSCKSLKAANDEKRELEELSKNTILEGRRRSQTHPAPAKSTSDNTDDNTDDESDDLSDDDSDNVESSDEFVGDSDDYQEDNESDVESSSDVEKKRPKKSKRAIKSKRARKKKAKLQSDTDSDDTDTSDNDVIDNESDESDEVQSSSSTD